MAGAFLDTTVILSHLLGDHPDHSPRATAYLGRVEKRELAVCTADTVIFDVVFTLARSYKRPRDQIRDAVLSLLELSGIILPGKRRYRQDFDLYFDRNLSFADAYHAVLAKHVTLDQIASFDRGFDRIAGIRRVEP